MWKKNKGMDSKEKQLCSIRRKLGATIGNRKALSPIFATLIILAVVTVLFIPVFIWATGAASQNQDSWQLSGTIASERIVVEEVNLRYNQANLCSIYVRNIGKTAVTINNVLIIAPDDNVYTYENPKGELSIRDPVTGNNLTSIIYGDLLEIKITNLKGLPVDDIASIDQVFTVKVFTTRGVGGEYQIAL